MAVNCKNLPIVLLSLNQEENMGSIMSAISDDIQEYRDLCDRYGERIQHSHGSPDCYGEHAKQLKARLDEDRRKEDERQLKSWLGRATIEQLQQEIKDKRAAIRERNNRAKKVQRASERIARKRQA
jgi:hypothetical protein